MEKLFSEQQRFRQVWLWILLIAINTLFIYGLVSQVFLGQTFGNKPMSNGGLIFATIFVVLLTLLFVFMRLDTEIKQDGIYYRFYPFQRMKKISWERISKACVRNYSPLGEFGGWGFRINLFGKGIAYNVSGNEGLQLVYDNNRKLLLGTQKPGEIKMALQQLGKLTNSD
ncbi:MAG: hypothetical protein KF900_00575 [Bacteroidetes bacterium]|nr:hypothetical protein [Bacteroidota bacterium]